MCLAKFVANYQVKYNSTVNDDNDDDDKNDVMPPLDDIEVTLPKVIQLNDDFGAMVKRKTKAVICFFKYSKDSDPSNYYRSRLMLYYPWYIEASDLLGGYESYEEHYNHVLNEIIQSERKYTAADVENVNYDEENRPQHAWDELAPGAEHGRGCDHDIGEVVEREVDQEDIDNNAALLNNPAGSASGSCNSPANLALRFESTANKEIIPANEYRSLM